MSDEVRVANCDCFDTSSTSDEWLEWLIIIGIIFIIFNGGFGRFFRRGCSSR